MPPASPPFGLRTEGGDKNYIKIKIPPMYIGGIFLFVWNHVGESGFFQTAIKFLHFLLSKFDYSVYD